MKIFNFLLLILYYFIVCKLVACFRIKSEGSSINQIELTDLNNDDRESDKSKKNTTHDDTKINEKKINKNGNEFSHNISQEKENKTKIESNTSHSKSVSNSENNYKSKNNLENFAATKNAPNQYGQDKDEYKNIIIPENAFKAAINVCDLIVFQNKHFQAFCNMTNIYEEIEKLKKNNNTLYQSTMNSYFENKNSPDTRTLKKKDDGELVEETDNPNPKKSILFMFAKFCTGDIPLVCSNISKYENNLDFNSIKVDKKNSDDDLFEQSFDGKTDIPGLEESIEDLTNEEIEAS